MMRVGSAERPLPGHPVVQMFKDGRDKIQSAVSCAFAHLRDALLWVQTSSVYLAWKIYSKCSKQGPISNYFNAPLIFRRNAWVIVDALPDSINALIHVSDSLLNNRQFLIAVAKKLEIAQQGEDYTLTQIQTLLGKDNQFAYFVCLSSPQALKYLDPAFKRDFSLVKRAAEEHLSALQYADDSIKKDGKLILHLLGHHVRWQTTDEKEVLQYAAPSLLKDPQFFAAKDLLGRQPFTSSSPHERCREGAVNWGQILRTLQGGDQTRTRPCDGVLEDASMASTVLQYNPSAFRFLHPSLQEKKELVLGILPLNPELILWLPDSYMKDPNFLWNAFLNQNRICEILKPEIVQMIQTEYESRPPGERPQTSPRDLLNRQIQAEREMLDIREAAIRC